MTFLINYLYSIVYTYCLGDSYSRHKLTPFALLLLLSPIFILWLLICGGQYYVGTDYPSYFQIFEGYDLDSYLRKHEYLFVGIIVLCNKIGIHGQALFYIFYAINFLFLFLIIKRIPIRYIFIFILLYITVTNLFNNQLNTLRQATAIYIGTYAVLLTLDNNNFKAFVFIIIASLIHQSALILILVLLFKRILLSLSYRGLSIFLLVATAMSFILQPNVLNFLLPFLPEDYAWYIERGTLVGQSFISRLTKYIFIPIYLLAWNYFKRHDLPEQDDILFKFGWVAFCLRLSLINIPIVSRITDYALILSILPLYLYLSHIMKEKHMFLFVSILFLLSLFYCLKVTHFATGEYLYNSIYF